MVREILYWIILITCFAIISIGDQYLGYKRAEKDILMSCLSDNEFTVKGMRLVCVRCPIDKGRNENNE